MREDGRGEGDVRQSSYIPNGKTDKRRPQEITAAQYAENYERTFGKARTPSQEKNNG